MADGRKGSMGRGVLVLILLGVLMPHQASSSLGPFVGRDDALELASRLVNETEAIYQGILADKPYHPSLFAWGMHYLARACLLLYDVTQDRHWLDKAINITDYLYLYSDVNGDGEPSWGSYNETWGISKWEHKEYTVWDAVDSLPVLELVKTIRSDPDLLADDELSAKAASYLELVRQVVERHHPFWTQVKPGQGYYWDDPSEDVGPYVNGFASLGTVELLLYELTGNATYLERPRQMAAFILANMRYNAADDLYTWDYKIKEGPPEDISHGAIDLEFLITASRSGLVDELHIMRLCNTYQKRIWSVPGLPQEGFPLAMRVDGSGEEDYTALSRGWAKLASYLPAIYDQQRIALGIHHERYGLYPAGYEVEAVAQILWMERELRSQGIDPEGSLAVTLEHLTRILHDASLRLNETFVMGAKADAAKALLEEAKGYISPNCLANASVPIALIWEAWDAMERAVTTGRSLKNLESEIDSAAEMGAEVSELRANLSRLWSDYSEAESEAAFSAIESRIAEAISALSKAEAEAAIRAADEVVRMAREAGIDTSRHEIFLRRAHEEFEKGNYGPALQFTAYPLQLREQIGELLARVSVTLAPLLLLARKAAGTRDKRHGPSRHHAAARRTCFLTP